MVRVREARPADVEAILRLVRDSAASQGALDAVCVDAPTLHDEMFGARARVHALVADADAVPVGVAIYFFTFSTWVSVNGIHLEDLYVDPAWRRQGVARALMEALVGVALASGCRRLQWFVMHSNADAVRFYESIGAKVAGGWAVMHLDRS
jgi:GNAT superfamily N-acetyltransferase